MSGLILPSRQIIQPQYAADLNEGSPLSKRPAFLWMPHYEAAQNAANTLSGTAPPTRATGPGGLAYLFNGGTSANSYISLGALSGDAVDIGRSPCTFFGVFSGSSKTDTALAQRNDNNATDKGWAFGGIYGGGLGLLLEFGSANLRKTITESPTSGVNVLVATHDGSQTAANCNVYLNGVLGTTGTSINGSGTSSTDSAQNLLIGAITFTSSISQNGLIYLVGAVRRQWTAPEVIAFSRNPWQIFKAPTRRLYIGAASGGADVTVAGFAGGTGATTGQKSQSATAAGIAGGAESATGKKAQSTTALGIAGQGGTATARKAQSATVLSFTGTGGAITGRKSQATTWLGTGGGVCVVSALHGGQTSVLGIAGAGGLISTVLNRSTTITGFAGGAGSATGQHGGAVTILGTLGGTGTNTARHAGNTAATGTAGAWAAFVGRKSQSTTYTVKAGGGGTITAVAGSVVEYSRAPSGMGSPLIYTGTERPAVISGNRPGNINTSRPANRGGRRT